MNNFEFEHNGQKYWYSRSVAVAGFVFTKINGEYNILLNKRGIGSPNFIGYWNCPCGYMDFNETCNDAVSREVYEETCVEIPTDDWRLITVNSNRVGSQNVTLLFGVIVDNIDPTKFKQMGGEENEIDEIKLVPISEISKYNFAFNHENRIPYVLEQLLNNRYLTL